jgi:hypothetical protein
MPAQDPYGNPGAVATGDVTDPVWGNAVTATIVRRFPTTTARDGGWPNPPRGALCVTTDTDTVWQAVGTPATWAALIPAPAVILDSCTPNGGSPPPAGVRSRLHAGSAVVSTSSAGFAYYSFPWGGFTYGWSALLTPGYDANVGFMAVSASTWNALSSMGMYVWQSNGAPFNGTFRFGYMIVGA